MIAVSLRLSSFLRHVHLMPDERSREEKAVIRAKDLELQRERLKL